jgi:hypothetical protein
MIARVDEVPRLAEPLCTGCNAARGRRFISDTNTHPLRHDSRHQADKLLKQLHGGVSVAAQTINRMCMQHKHRSTV